MEAKVQGLAQTRVDWLGLPRSGKELSHVKEKFPTAALSLSTAKPSEARLDQAWPSLCIHILNYRMH